MRASACKERIFPHIPTLPPHPTLHAHGCPARDAGLDRQLLRPAPLTRARRCAMHRTCIHACERAPARWCCRRPLLCMNPIPPLPPLDLPPLDHPTVLHRVGERWGLCGRRPVPAQPLHQGRGAEERGGGGRPPAASRPNACSDKGRLHGMACSPVRAQPRRQGRGAECLPGGPQPRPAHAALRMCPNHTWCSTGAQGGHSRMGCTQVGAPWHTCMSWTPT